jgi:glucokinase
VGGRLNRGAHYFANALGHVQIEPEGLPCTCGRRGCLEVYANAAALLRYAGGRFSSAEEAISAASGGNTEARSAVCALAHHLARGCAAILHVLDPEMLILAGGLVQNNPLLLERLESELAGLTTVWEQRRLQLRLSPLAYYGGVYGAAAVAFEAGIG